MIEVRHLTKKYGSHLAVDDLSFSVNEGQIYGLLGPNGAGKSTTMNMITGYLSPSAGTVLVDGHDIQEEPEEAKRCIGFLPEQPPLYTDMTVREYLAFAAELKKVGKKERAAQVESVVRRTGLEKVESRLIRNLSKGYRQRVGIAQALLGTPKVIILDEPTVGLDPAQVIEIRRLVRELGKTHTVILSSHILSEVQAICDQVLILSQGKLAACGAPETLSDKLSDKGLLRVTALGTWTKIEKAVSGLKGVVTVKQESHSGDEVTFTVRSRKGTDLRAAVSRALAEADCAVLHMAQESMSLEEVFLQLTETTPLAEAEETALADEKTNTENAAADANLEESAAAEADTDTEPDSENAADEHTGKNAAGKEE
ncbi:MAG: ABC transporter ATP-binding protein [Faecalibacterium sp.]|nr:ABC transporter ATP-binding protein [Faecalibacterium sp.]